ncbi:hypothetical protein EDB81DRAFT_789373 [Dactylonectria macrodidyma]|uniref:Uncharacterized protein n=1 Tax=Dactylonectria macrodidyma TaxID=307937 RepID=A0A9P9F4D0_9HYPO|nr:hypothetical protein EDB81DRAFT_789373 [Dactylonectria macrodidyma]
MSLFLANCILVILSQDSHFTAESVPGDIESCERDGIPYIILLFQCSTIPSAAGQTSHRLNDESSAVDTNSKLSEPGLNQSPYFKY